MTSPGRNAIKAVCPCGRLLSPTWVSGLTLRFQCRRHPERLAIIHSGDQVLVARTVTLMTEQPPYTPSPVQPPPQYRPVPKPDHPKLVAICLVCGIRVKHEDGGYHVRYWCPHHSGAPMFFIAVEQLESEGWTGPQQVNAWAGNGWSRMKAPKTTVKPVAAGHI